MLGIIEAISGLFTPVAKLVDDLHTSDEEKLELNKQLTMIQNEFSGKVLDYEKSLIQAQASIVKAEAQGHSWLQRNWRPILMLTVVAIIANNYILFPYARALGANAVQLDLPDHMWQLMKIGVGGYIVGRSGESIANSLRK
jgi:hypothetical protein